MTDYIYADGRPIAVLHPGATPTTNQVNYILADRLGTPQLASNSSGTTVWETTYQPFGTTGVITASIAQNLRFPGQYADTETGFNYNLNRDYMPNLGRYLQSDLIGINGGMNPYLYVVGNPLNYRDPQGLWAGIDDAVFTLGGGGVGVVGQGISDLLSGKVSSWQDYVGAAVGGAVGGETLLYTAPYTGPVASSLAGAAAQNLTTQWLNNMTGKQCGYNWNSALDATAIGGLTGLITIGIPGITVGQGDWNSIFEQMTTKLSSGTISDISTETALKMFGSQVPDAIAQSIVNGFATPNVAH